MAPVPLSACCLTASHCTFHPLPGKLELLLTYPSFCFVLFLSDGLCSQVLPLRCIPVPFWVFFSFFLNCYLFIYFLISYPFYTHQCIHVIPNRPVHHTTTTTPPPLSPLGVHTFIFFSLIYLFIYFWLCWVFVSVRGLSLVAASGGHSSSRCVGLSLSRPLLLRSTGSRRTSSVVVAHGLCCSVTCGIFPDQGSNPCPLHWQADSQPLHHQGSPHTFFSLLLCLNFCSTNQFICTIF